MFSEKREKCAVQFVFWAAFQCFNDEITCTRVSFMLRYSKGRLLRTVKGGLWDLSGNGDVRRERGRNRLNDNQSRLIIGPLFSTQKSFVFRRSLCRVGTGKRGKRFSPLCEKQANGDTKETFKSQEANGLADSFDKPLKRGKRTTTKSSPFFFPHHPAENKSWEINSARSPVVTRRR